jgi:hypothetical protein
MNNSDNAHKLLNSIIEPLEVKFGEITNVETVKEGRNIFRMSVIFCNDKGKMTFKLFEVCCSIRTVKEIKRRIK